MAKNNVKETSKTKKTAQAEALAETARPAEVTREAEAAREPVRTMKQVDIRWEAEEYIVREKTTWWYVGLIAVGLVMSGVSVLLQWWSFLAVVILSVVALMIYAMRPPRMLSYALTNKGLSEGEKLYAYSDFKAFGLLREGSHFAIVLTPRKRFAPRVTVFFPEAQGEEIVDAFGARLPMEEVKLDMLDKLIKFLRI